VETLTQQPSNWQGLVPLIAQRFPHYELFGDEAIRFLFPFKTASLETFIKHMARDHASWISIGIRLANNPAGPDLVQLSGERQLVGSLCLAGSQLCVSHSLPLRGLRADHLDWTLNALGAAALHYRAILDARVPDSSSLAYLAD